MATLPLQSIFLPKAKQLVSQLTNNKCVSTLLSHRYGQLLRSEKHYDCIFHVDGTNVKCHKLILAAASPVFEAMFYGPIREEKSEIEILDISPAIFNVLMSYIYVGSVDFETLTIEETVELYYGAEKYLLGELIDDCLMAIARKLRFSNILPALELSVCLDLSALLEVCMSFFTRCCLSDPQYMAYLKAHYLHISKDCVKHIIAANKDLRQYLLWFVYEWCQRECNELGLKHSDCALIIDDLQLKESGLESADLLRAQPMKQHNIISIERSYYKACRPFTVDCDDREWRLIVKSERFVSLHGIIMLSRLTPNLTMLNFPTEYSENVDIEISALNHAPTGDGGGGGGSSDGEEDSDHQEDNCNQDVIIWRHSIAKQPTKYNCDFSITWDQPVIIRPDVDYQIKLIWQSNAYGAEYPCSLQSNVVDGIQFRDFDAHYGSLIKGLRLANLV